MITQKQLIQITESAIENLVETFKETPYLFYTENDLHCYPYAQILSKLPMDKWVCETADGKKSILLHKEYPTKERYKRETLEEGVKKGSRGHFDLTIWNPSEVGKRSLRALSSNRFDEEQRTFIAIELDLIEGNDGLKQAIHHFNWDLLKLRDKENKVENGYSLVFVRDWIHREEFLEGIRDEVVEEQGIMVLYVESSQDRKLIKTLSHNPFFDYEH